MIRLYAMSAVHTDSSAADDALVKLKDLIAEEYAQLHVLASKWFRRERAHQTLQATALVHEAYVQVYLDHADEPRARLYYLAAMSRAMRQILVQKARRRGVAQRAVDHIRVTSPSGQEQDRRLDLVDLDDALTRLENEHKRAASVAALRIFGEMTSAQIAALFGVSERTTQLDWRFAKAWLASELADA